MSLNRSRSGSNEQPRHRLADAIASKQDTVRDAAIKELLNGGNDVDQAIPALTWVLDSVPPESQEVIRDVFRKNKYTVERYFNRVFSASRGYELIDVATEHLRLLEDAGVVPSLQVLQGYNRGSKEKVLEGLKSNADRLAETLVTEVLDGDGDRSQVAAMVLATLRSNADFAFLKALSEFRDSKARPQWTSAEHSLTCNYSEPFALQLENELTEFVVECFRHSALEEAAFQCNTYHYAFALATLCPNPLEVARLFIDHRRSDYGLAYDDEAWIQSIGLQMVQFTGTTQLRSRAGVTGFPLVGLGG